MIRGVLNSMRQEAYLPVLMGTQQRRHGCHDLIMGLRDGCWQVSEVQTSNPKSGDSWATSSKQRLQCEECEGGSGRKLGRQKAHSRSRLSLTGFFSSVLVQNSGTMYCR